MTPFAKLLRTKLNAAGMPASTIARRAGVSAGFLSSLSSGRKTPSALAVGALGRALNLSAAEIEEMGRAAKCSQRRLMIPKVASPAAYIFLHDTVDNVSGLSDDQIDIAARVFALRGRDSGK